MIDPGYKPVSSLGFVKLFMMVKDEVMGRISIIFDNYITTKYILVGTTSTYIPFNNLLYIFSSVTFSTFKL